jgi:hypothetical protein
MKLDEKITMRKLFVIFALIFISILFGRLAKIPATIEANRIELVPFQQQRDLSKPSSRLVGNWRCVTDGHKLHFCQPQNSQNSVFDYGGIFFWNNNVGSFTILIESYSEDQLTTRESFFLGKDFVSTRVKYDLPKDGQSMNRKILFENGSQLMFDYFYVDN